MIKKILTGAFVALTFLIYSLHQRNEGSAAVAQVATSASTASTTGTTTSSTDTASTTPTTTSTSTSTSTGQYKDGSYTGTAADAIYGYIQVKITVSSGKISDLVFLQYPNDRRDSIQINNYAMPILKQQAIAAQSASVDGVSGATDSSQAFVQSLTAAINQAKA